MLIGHLTAILTADTSRFDRSLSKVGKSASKFAAASVAAFAGVGVGAAGAAVGVVAVGAAIGGLAVGLAGVGIKAAMMRKDVQDAFKGLSEHVTAAMMKISGPIATALKSIMITARKEFDQLSPILGKAFTRISPFIRSIGQSITRGLGGGLQKLVPALTGVFETMAPSLEKIGPALKSGLGWLAEHLGPMLQAMVPALRMLFQGLSNVIGGLARFFRNLGEAVGDGNTYWQQLTKLLELLLPPLGSVVGALALVGGAIVEDLMGPIQKLLPVVSDIAEFIGKNANGVAQAVEAVAAIWVANWVRMRVTALANAVWMGASWLIALGPIGAVIAGVAAVIAFLVLLWKKNDAFRNAVLNAWDAIKRKWAELEPERQKLIAGFKAIADWIQEHWKPIAAWLAGPFGIAVALIIKYWDQIGPVVKRVLNWIGEHWKPIVAFLAGPIGWAVALIIRYWDEIKAAWERTEGWRDRLVAAFNTLREAAGRVFAWIRDHVVEAWHKIQEVWANTEGWRDRLVAAFNSLRDTAGMVFAWVRDRVVEAWGKIQEVWQNTEGWRDKLIAAFNAIRDAASSAFAWIRDRVVEAWDKIKEKWDSTEETRAKLTQTFRDIKNVITQEVREIWDVLQEKWDLIKTKWDELKPKVDDLKEAFTNLKNTIAEAVGQIVTLLTGDDGSVHSATTGAGRDVKNLETDTTDSFGKIAGAVDKAVNWISAALDLLSIPISIAAAVFGGLATVIAFNMNIAALVVKAGVWLIVHAWDFLVGAYHTVRRILGWIKDKFQWLFDVLVGHSIVPDIVNGIIRIFGTLPARVIAVIASLPGRIVGVFASAGSLLYNAGASIIRGLIKGISSKIGELTSKLGGITKLIPSWKGPRIVDEKLLAPSGQLIMSGLIEGITASIPHLRALLADVTRMMPASLTANVKGSAGFAGIPTTASAQAGAGVTLVFSGPVYADSQGIRRLADELMPAIQRKTRSYGRSNAGDSGF